jgi:hypothetical protein
LLIILQEVRCLLNEDNETDNCNFVGTQNELNVNVVRIFGLSIKLFYQKACFVCIVVIRKFADIFADNYTIIFNTKRNSRIRVTFHINIFCQRLLL